MNNDEFAHKVLAFLREKPVETMPPNRLAHIRDAIHRQIEAATGELHSCEQNSVHSLELSRNTTQPSRLKLPFVGPPDFSLYRWTSRRSMAVAASVLIILAGLAVYFSRTPAPKQSGDDTPYEFTPTDTFSSLSNSKTSTTENRSIALSIPAIPIEAFRSSRDGHLVMMEFSPDALPRVWPDSDILCPQIVPDKAVSLGADPVIRPLRGSKNWVVLVVTDRPASDTLKNLLRASYDFDRDIGPTASSNAVIGALKTNGFQIIAYGNYQIKPMFN
jgi:hypothetical protein